MYSKPFSYNCINRVPLKLWFKGNTLILLVNIDSCRKITCNWKKRTSTLKNPTTTHKKVIWLKQVVVIYVHNRPMIYANCNVHNLLFVTTSLPLCQQKHTLTRAHSSLRIHDNNMQSTVYSYYEYRYVAKINPSAPVLSRRNIEHIMGKSVFLFVFGNKFKDSNYCNKSINNNNYYN